MTMYHKILAAVDGSESSLHALKESFKLAAGGQALITVVSVLPPYQGDLSLVGVKNVKEMMRRPCQDNLAQAEKLALAAGVWIKTLCAEGEIFEEVVDLAEKDRCDLIVMGRRQRRLLERALVGSNTARVIGYSSVDVLVVPKETTVSFEKMLLATDGSQDSQVAAQRALDLAEMYQRDLIVISVADVRPETYGVAPQITEGLIAKAKEYVAEVKNQAALGGINVTPLVREGDPFEVITKFAAENGVSLIIMGSHGVTGLRRLLMGSVTEKVLGHTPCPVLVVKVEE